MSGYAVVLDGAAISALVVGGGAVGTRRALALSAAGARVHVVAPEIAPELAAASRRGDLALRISERGYESGDVADAHLVVAATSSRAVNARVAADAHAQCRLVNVADAPTEGNYRAIVQAGGDAGGLLVAVSAAGVPSASRRILAEITQRFDGRYEQALRALAGLRERLLAERGSAAWRTASDALIGDDFCAAVESGTFTERVAQWR